MSNYADLGAIIYISLFHDILLDQHSSSQIMLTSEAIIHISLFHNILLDLRSSSHHTQSILVPRALGLICSHVTKKRQAPRTRMILSPIQ